MGGIFAALLLVPFAYLGVQTLQAVSQIQPGSDAKIAEHLKDTGHDRGTVLIQGGRIKEYLPEARVINRPKDAQGEEIEVVIIRGNSSNDTRPRHEATRNYLETNKDEFELSYTSDDKEVYVRKSDD